MIINEDGRIAYHALVLKENGGLQFIQNDYDGKPLNRILTSSEKFVYYSVSNNKTTGI